MGLGDFECVRIPDTHPSMSLSERFEAFHRANPHVYRAIVKVSRGARAMGHEHYSIARIFEYLRYTSLVTTGEEWKLNNSYRAFYARMAMSREPDLANFFETRTQRHGVAA